MFQAPVGTVIAATGAGDTSAINVMMLLPKNFAFVMTDFSCQIRAAGNKTNNYDAIGTLRISDANNARTYTQMCPINSEGVARVSDQEVRNYCPAMLPDTMIVPPTGVDEGGFVDFWVSNIVANDFAYTISVYAKFLQYNIIQSFDYRVNAPIPVR